VCVAFFNILCQMNARIIISECQYRICWCKSATPLMLTLLFLRITQSCIKVDSYAQIVVKHTIFWVNRQKKKKDLES
jgi:hypothetical protein